MEHQQLDKLYEQLSKNTQWPLLYMFKFIVPNHDGKVEQVTKLLPSDGKISFKHTPNLKYVSVTCVATMPSAQHIISITSNAIQISGVMAL